MSFLNVVTLLGGLSLFLYGMRLSGEQLQKAAGRRLKFFIAAVTGNRLSAFAMGSGITVLTNSSSATGVILVTLTNAGLISSYRAIAVFLGAAVGTTVTIQIIAFKVTTYALVLVALGFGATLFKRGLVRTLGGVVMSFGLIFFGMHLMSEAMNPLETNPEIRETIISLAGDRFLMLAAGLLLTAVIQSSSASIGILVALTFTGSGSFDLGGCFAFVLGANVGTCVTALLASIGGTPAAGRVAYGFLLAKTVAVLLFFPIIGPFANLVTDIAGSIEPDTSFARLIAHTHLGFNLILAAVFLPFLGHYDALLGKIAKPRKPEVEKEPRFLSSRVLGSPHVALATVRKELAFLFRTAQAMADVTIEAFQDDQVEPFVDEKEKTLDRRTVELIRYLAVLSQGDLDQSTSEEIVACLNVADETEALGDLVDNVVIKLAHKYRENALDFSKEGWRDVRAHHEEVMRSFRELAVAFRMGNPEMGARVAARHAEVGEKGRELRLRHLNRLAMGEPGTAETSSVHLDLVGTLSAMHSHLANIGRNLEKIL